MSDYFEHPFLRTPPRDSLRDAYFNGSEEQITIKEQFDRLPVELRRDILKKYNGDDPARCLPVDYFFSQVPGCPYVLESINEEFDKLYLSTTTIVLPIVWEDWYSVGNFDCVCNITRATTHVHSRLERSRAPPDAVLFSATTVPLPIRQNVRAISLVECRGEKVTFLDNMEGQRLEDLPVGCPFRFSSHFSEITAPPFFDMTQLNEFPKLERLVIIAQDCDQLLRLCDGRRLRALRHVSIIELDFSESLDDGICQDFQEGGLNPNVFRFQHDSTVVKTFDKLFWFPPQGMTLVIKTPKGDPSWINQRLNTARFVMIWLRCFDTEGVSFASWFMDSSGYGKCMRGRFGELDLDEMFEKFKEDFLNNIA